MFKILFNNKSVQLLAKNIFNNYEVVNEIVSKSHYKIIKTFFPKFNENILYKDFLVFPCSNSDIKISGIGKSIKLHGVDVNAFFKTEVQALNKDDKIYNLVLNDFLKLFNNNIPYGIFYIYEIENKLYLIMTTNKNSIVILNKSTKLEELFYEKILNENVFNFHPLSEQGVKFIYYNNIITGVIYGIGTI